MGGKKLTYESVKKHFEEEGCELLQTDNINSTTKMKYRCSCGNESEIRYNKFKIGQRCRKCAGNEKLTFQFVQKYFKEQECELLETEYTNSNIPMKYLCVCGNQSTIRFSSFKLGQRCKKCAGLETLTYKYVKNFFEKNGCKLLEPEYINSSTKIKYICKNGHNQQVVFGSFHRGKRCKTCAHREKHTFEDVQKYFKEQECELLDTEYIDSNTPMKYICKCGNESKIRYSNFKQGQRCMKCLYSFFTIDNIKKYFIEHKCELLEDEYISSDTKMKYCCKCGNKSNISWDNFKQGCRCRLCGYEKIEKSGKTHKDYILPSNKIIRIQGYENVALDELIKVYKEDDIITDKRNMPKITYYFEDKQRRYYPDIYIKSINKIVEIKSDWTYNKDLEKNKLKEITTKELNFNFEFWIYKPISRTKKTYSKEIVVN